MWGSLSRENMERALAYENDPDNAPTPPGLFSWLCNSIRFYPEVENVKMLAYFQPKLRPRFEVQQTDHLLSLDATNGIEPARLVEIMRWRLPELRLPDGIEK